MLWTRTPTTANLRILQMGSMNSTSNPTITTPTAATGEYAACIDTLHKNGYYGIGTTAVSWKATKPLDGFPLEGLPVNIICESVLGYGMVEFSALQRAGNSRTAEMNVFWLYLGWEGVNGSVVMGGFDEGLLDHGHKAVSSKANVNSEGFEVAVTSAKCIRGGGGGGKETEVYKSTTGGTHIALSYNSSRLRLLPDMRSLPLPLLGRPGYDKGINKHVYTGIPLTDYTLCVKLSNGTSTMVSRIPITSRITADESTDNPVTSQRESGQTYLRTAPVSPTDGSCLGPASLEHIHLTNAPPTTNKPDLSAVPSPARRSNLTPASRNSIAIFFTDSTQTNTAPRDTPAPGPMTGSTPGGVVLPIPENTARIAT
ncbi:hypothetical protein C7212DRAFT_346147 [Tuber magnatum]|uniref:Uncharacterized protein n=1 Tax=Tuber magnatum TaxID=42249 RepID=A0A317SL65_9PEZI|nr:hypothetical protein C7212DRAFT_346147 [Tuber magnatum]